MSAEGVSDQRRRMAVDIQSGPMTDKAMSRRGFLRVIGGGAALVAVGAVGALDWRAVDQGIFSAGDGPAYAAWRDWRGHTGGGPLNLVRAAVLAANGHNTQPWLFRVDPSGIALSIDGTRSMGSLDPLHREQVISLGCALENLLLAAGPNGLTATPRLLPDPDNPALVAVIALTPGQAHGSPLYDAIPKRHTNRGAYDTKRPVPSETLAAMAALNEVPDLRIVWYASGEEKQAFAGLTVRATEAINADEEQSIDSFAWWRGNWADLQDRKDGITLDASGLPRLTRTLGKLLPDVSRAASDEAWLKSTKDPQLATAAAFGLVAARDASNVAQRLATGRLWQRMHLWATTQGLAMQPLNQSVERRDREQAAGLPPTITQGLAALLPEPGWQAMMPFRLGYPTAMALKSPRRPAESVILRP